MMKEQQQRSERPGKSIEVGSGSQIVVHSRSSKCVQDVGGLVQPI